MNTFLKEACVENLKQAISAEKNGTNRIELCSNLEVGGLTPSEELIQQVLQNVSLPVRIMIRPRAGDFCYSAKEILQMHSSIEFCKEVGVEGVVFGVLKADKTLDLQVISELLAKANPLKIVIHKAIDEAADPLQEICNLVKLGGVDTILTSGGFTTATEGKEILKKMHEICQDKIELMPGGKITEKNISELHHFIEARAYHGRLIMGNLD